MDADLDDEEKSEGAAWMATFADLMTLLLTFFVLLISFATMDVIKFQMMLGVGQGGDGRSEPAPRRDSDAGHSPCPAVRPRKHQQARDHGRHGHPQRHPPADSQGNLQAFVEAELGERGVIVRVRGQLLYDLGSDDLRSDGLSVLDTIATISHKFETG